MDSKRIRVTISRFFSWLSLTTCSLIIKVMPAGAIYCFANVLGAIAFRVSGRHRKVALESLSIAFGKEKTAQELRHIAKSCFTYLGRSGMELLYYMDKPQAGRKRASLVHREHLDNALSKGRGVILISAHFGNFPMMLAWLSLAGYKISGIMRPMRDTRAEKMFHSARDRYHIKTIYSIPRSVCVANTLKTLRNNEIVFIPMDQNFGTGGVFVDFFGRKAATATGPIILAQRTKAALVPCFIVRQRDNTHKIIFEPAVPLIEGRNSEETILLNVQKITGVIEKYIRMHPAEWGWIHRRWKSKPS